MIIEPTSLEIANQIVDTARAAKDKLIADKFYAQEVMIQKLNERIEELEGQMANP